MEPGSTSLRGTYIKLVMVSLFWAGTFISTRVAAQVLGPFTGASFRYSIALIFLLPMALQQNRQLFSVRWKQLPLLLLLGFSGIFAYNYFFFKGLKTVPASRGALLVALNPIFVMLMSAVIYQERITLRKAVGIIISLAGVIVVISRGRVTELMGGLETGDLFMLGCPLTWAVYTMAGKPVLKYTTPLQASAWASLSGLIMLLLFSSGETYSFSNISPKVWLALAYLGIVGTVIAFVWYYDGIKKIGPMRTAIFTNLVPVFAVLLSVIVLREQVSWYTWAGGILVIGGVWLVTKKN
jgi:drug/metabolite transporter (DMT)-like permease